MTYFADGTLQDDRDEGPAIRVGWLDAEHPFPTAIPTREFDHALVDWCVTTERRVRDTMGFHCCDFCSEPVWYNGERASSSYEIRVIGPSGTVYAAPALIAHYVSAHHYAPPDDFVAGVLAGTGSWHELPVWVNLHPHCPNCGEQDNYGGYGSWMSEDRCTTGTEMRCRCGNVFVHELQHYAEPIPKRTLRATWSFEAASEKPLYTEEELRAVKSMFDELITDEVLRDIDREIEKDMLLAAQRKARRRPTPRGGH
jgi:hypothetical protein